MKYCKYISLHLRNREEQNKKEHSYLYCAYTNARAKVKETYNNNVIIRKEEEESLNKRGFWMFSIYLSITSIHILYIHRYIALRLISKRQNII